MGRYEGSRTEEGECDGTRRGKQNEEGDGIEEEMGRRKEWRKRRK